MRIILGMALAAAAFSGVASAKDRNACEIDWRAAHASGSPLSHDRFIQACLKGEPSVTAQTTFPNPPTTDVTVPRVSVALPKSLGSSQTCANAGGADPQQEQACNGPGGVPKGVK
jgi:hypothetical protein